MTMVNLLLSAPRNTEGSKLWNTQCTHKVQRVMYEISLRESGWKQPVQIRMANM